MLQEQASEATHAGPVVGDAMQQNDSASIVRQRRNCIRTSKRNTVLSVNLDRLLGDPEAGREEPLLSEWRASLSNRVYCKYTQNNSRDNAQRDKGTERREGDAEIATL